MRHLMLALALALAPTTLLAADTVGTGAVQSAANPVLAEWIGPYGGIPALGAVRVEQLQPAMEQAMEAYLVEIDAIANASGRPTFDNTIAALERSGAELDRAMAVFGIWRSTMSSPEVRSVAQAMAPKLAALGDVVTQNTALFERVDAVYTWKKKAKKLTAEQQRLTWVVWNRFVRSGARLPPEAKSRLGNINQELATLFTTFGDNLLHDEETWVVIDEETHLAGLPDDFVAAASRAAADRDLEGSWVVLNTRSWMEPFLTFSTVRSLREQVWRAYVDRGDHGDEFDNNENITEILALRAERAKLLGHPTHAHWRLANTMAGTPEVAMALLESMWGPAVERVREEVADQQALADAAGDKITIKPWDYRFYQEKVRKDRYDLDQSEIKPYLQLEKLREGMFWMAGQLYDLHFTQVFDVPVHHPDVRVWQVKNDAGEHVGLWYFDPYAREGKRSGAWMNAYRTQRRMDGEVHPIVSNNCNFVKGGEGEPVLISWEDASTLFHEFGHAVHGLLSNVTYPTLAGTAVARDYVEFPSQLHEHWLATPEVLSRFALHVETGEPIPEQLVQRIEKASTFNQGFATVEYLASALIDMKLHLAGDTPIDADAFERETLAELGMPDEIVMRHRTPQFAHVFASDGYSAGYYSYLWSDTLTSDAAEAFEQAPGGMWDAGVASALVQHILSVGNTIDPTVGFRGFRGRDVDTAALMRKRGFPVAE